MNSHGSPDAAITIRWRLQVGNEVPSDRLYIERPEDYVLAKRIRDRQWINIVAARTMGKSSMFDRTARILAAEGFVCARSDLALDSSEVARHEIDPLSLFEGQVRSWLSVLRRRTTLKLTATELRQYAARLRESLSEETDGDRAWELLKYLVEQTDNAIDSRGATYVLAIDEVQLLSRLGCRLRFMQMIRDLTQIIVGSSWRNRLVLCFIGWEAFGAFSTDARLVAQQIVHTHEIRDFDANDESVVKTLSLAFPNEVDASTAIREILRLTGGHPLITCCATERVRLAIELDSVAVSKFLDVVHKKLIIEKEEFRRELMSLVSHTEMELKESTDARIALELYERLLKAHQYRMSAERMAGVETLCRVGLTRCVRTAKREWIQIKSPMFALWFDSASVQAAKAEVSYRKVIDRRPSNSECGRVCIITVGGTVCMERPGGGERTKFIQPDQIAKYLEQAAGLPPIDVVHFGELDSINVHPVHWKPLVEKIAEQLAETAPDGKHRYSGIVVAHGTDTLSFTASYAAFALNELMDRPIVFTGSQAPLDAFDSDGPMNLYTACRVAMKGTDLPEVVVVFGRRVLRAVQAVKRHDFEYEGINSPMSPELGVVSETVELYHDRIRSPSRINNGKVLARMVDRVLLIELMPGLEPDLYEEAISRNVSGIILQTLGAGNVSDFDGFDFTQLVQRAWHEFTIPVLVTSKVPVDPVTYTRYERGVKAIDKGAVPAMNMTSSAAATKFRWVLAAPEIRRKIERIRASRVTENHARQQLRALIWKKMREDIAGETATEWELAQSQNAGSNDPT